MNRLVFESKTGTQHLGMSEQSTRLGMPCLKLNPDFVEFRQRGVQRPACSDDVTAAMVITSAITLHSADGLINHPCNFLLSQT
jgi:hypothetical protein